MSYGFGRINDMCHEAFATAKEKGFNAEIDFNDTRMVLSMLALVHTEVSEAVEAARKGNRENFEEELADTVIRVFALSGAMGVNLEQAIVNKMEKNKNRPHQHGGKRA